MPPKDTPMPFRTALPWTGFVALLFLLNYMSRSTLTPLLVSIEQDLGIGHAQATSLLLMQSAGFSSALAVSGFLLSRFKPRQIATVPLAAAGCMLLLMPLVQTLGQARLVFVAFGLGVGFYFPAGMATLSSLVYPKDWGKAVAIHELAPNTGFILIPLLAQAGLLFTDWRGVFAIMGLLMIGTAAAFLHWGRGGNACTDAPSFRGCGRLLKNPASWIVTFLLAVSMIGEFSIYSVLQIFLVSAVGFGPDEANLGLSISRLAMPFIVIAAGWAADRFNAKRTVSACFLLHAVALCLMSVDASVSRLPALCGVFLQAASMAFVFPPLFKVFAQCFLPDEQPILLSLTMPIAGLISAGGVPFFIGEFYPFGLAFLIIAAMSAASAVSVAYLKGRG
ncbi:MFS transporter [uncultured Bilophila sp.]|uniref:MFS transporter n=1 Tax=uncultured Bilophila sp. TaxID=529385 RepID=UPI00280BF6FF|nr:MFS transporter [uncultured Bilophila sp.]